MRADAQRNYDRLLEEARQAFVVHGTDASLEDLARHAGVGIGTLYRHFPDRYALMNAVFQQEVDKLTGRARELLTADSPTEALLQWLRMVALHSAAYRGLAAAVMSAPDNKMPACRTPLREAGGMLLERAQRAGEVRGHITIADLLQLTNAIVLTAEKTPEDRTLFDRLMGLVMDGLREPALPASARTEQQAAQADAGRR